MTATYHNYLTRLFSLCIAATTAVTGCSSIDTSGPSALTELRVIVLPAPSKLLTAHLTKTSKALYVSGSLRHGPGAPHAPQGHVNVVLVDSDGGMLAEAQDRVDALHYRRSGSPLLAKHSFTVSFDIETARQAAEVHVHWHPERHSHAASAELMAES